MPTIDRIETSKTAAKKPAAATSQGVIAPREVITELEQHILVDGFKLVFDTAKSRGSRFVDAATGRELIDLYGFYASQPIGFNHPYFHRPEVKADLLAAAKVKVANADVYTVQYATFVRDVRARGRACRRWTATSSSKAARWRWKTPSRPPWIGRSARTSPPGAASAGRRSSISSAPSTGGAATR